jgi:formylglycine-generating enzyme required for sulfatase activity
LLLTGSTIACNIEGSHMKKTFTLPLMVHLICFTAVAMLLVPLSVCAEREKHWKEPLTGIEFVWVPSGCHLIGSPDSETGREPDEGPVREVCMDGFWLGKNEVTVGQFRAFVDITGYRTEAEREGFSWTYHGEWVKKAGYTWGKTGFPQNDNHPVVNVSLNDAKAMAKWLMEQSGQTFRLPTEPEWEYACRAGASTIRFWGDDPQEACRYANIADLDARDKFPAWMVHDCRDGYVFTAPAGSYRPNSFGLYDMLGNVWEWCENIHDSSTSKSTGKNSLIRTSDGFNNVIRGASWYSRPEHDRCANRDYVHSPSRRGTDLGFRLVRIP